MRYGIIAALSAAAISLGAAGAGAQTVQRTAAQNAWCASHPGQCSTQRDIRRDRTGIAKDLNKVHRQRADVRADTKDIRSDRALYGANPTPAERRDVAHDRTNIRADKHAIKTEKRDVRGDRRDVRKDHDRDQDRDHDRN